MRDKTQGGEISKNQIFCLTDKTKKLIGAKNKKDRKDRITYVDKSPPGKLKLRVRWGLGYAKPSQGQDQTRVR